MELGKTGQWNEIEWNCLNRIHRPGGDYSRPSLSADSCLLSETPAERGAPIHGAGGASSPNQTKQTIGCPSGGKSRVVQGAPNGGNKYRPIRRPQDKCTGPKGWPGRQRKNIPFACRQVARPRGRCGGHGAPAECPTSPSQGAPLGGRHPQVAFGAAHRAQYVSKTHVQSFLIHC
eukprot:gene9314-biopygen1666